MKITTKFKLSLIMKYDRYQKFRQETYQMLGKANVRIQVAKKGISEG
jgi:hypothetical protein